MAKTPGLAALDVTRKSAREGQKNSGRPANAAITKSVANGGR